MITSITPKSGGSSASVIGAGGASSTNANGGTYFTLHSPPIGCSDSDEEVDEQLLVESAPLNYEKVFTPQTRLQKFKTWVAETKFHFIFNIVFNLLNWGHFFYYLVLVPTGVATFCVYGQGKSVFNLLAHFIKGGVFLHMVFLHWQDIVGPSQTKDGLGTISLLVLKEVMSIISGLDFKTEVFGQWK